MCKPRKIVNKNGNVQYDILVRKHSNMVHVVFAIDKGVPHLISAWEVGYGNLVYGKSDGEMFERNHPGLLNEVARKVI